MSTLIRILEKNNLTLDQFIDKLQMQIENSSEFNEFSQFYVTFLSMIKMNKGKYMCPFNPWYFALTDKQISHLKWLRDKSYNGKFVKDFYFLLDHYHRVDFSFYTPNGRRKTYIGLIINNIITS